MSITEENENFKLLTKKNIILKKLKLNKQLKNKNKFDESKLEGGKFAYQNNNNNDDQIQYLVNDKSLMNGNQLPDRFGKFPENFLKKPLEELDPYIRSKEEVSET